MTHRKGGIHVADDSLQSAVEGLTANIADPNLRAQFSGFARLHGIGEGTRVSYEHVDLTGFDK